jgi:hypothetical protein
LTTLNYDTCGNLDKYPSYFTAEHCVDDTAVAIQALAAFCGCPGAEPFSRLCLDGSAPLDASKPLLCNDASTCGELAYMLSVLGESDCYKNEGTIVLNAAECNRDGATKPPATCNVKIGKKLGTLF